MRGGISTRSIVLAGLLLRLACLLPVPTEAAQLTLGIQNSDDLVIPVFDSSLGTLTNVSLNITLRAGASLTGGIHDHATYQVFSSNAIDTSLVNPFQPFQLTIDPTGSTTHSALSPAYSGGGLNFSPFNVQLLPSGFHGHVAAVTFAGMQQVGLNAYRMVANIDTNPDTSGHTHAYSPTGTSQSYSGANVAPFLAPSNIVIPAGPFLSFPDGVHSHFTPPFSQTVNTAFGNRTVFFPSSQVTPIGGHTHEIDPRFDVLATFTYDPVQVVTSQVGVAYVANTAGDSVSIVSMPTQSVANNIPVGDAPRYVAFPPNGSRAYVTNSGSDTVSVIDTAAQTVIDTINVGDQPESIVITADGQRAYVANYNSASISVIDLTTNIVSSFNTPPNPSSLALHPTRDELWVGYNSSSGNAALQARSLADNSVLDSANAGRFYASTDLAIAPDGSFAIGSEGCGACGRFHKISGDLPFAFPQLDILANGEGAARGVAINPTNNVAYLAKLGQNGFTSSVTEFGGAGRSVVTSDPRELTVSADGKFIYLTQGNGTVAVIDATTFSVINSIPVGLTPHGIAIQPAPLLAGDFNGNGVVDAADYTIWRQTLGINVLSFTGADADGNGLIDATDYGLWRSNFGHTAGSSTDLASVVALSATVPEPSTGALLIIVAIAIATRMRRST